MPIYPKSNARSHNSFEGFVHINSTCDDHSDQSRRAEASCELAKLNLAWIILHFFSIYQQSNEDSLNSIKFEFVFIVASVGSSQLYTH